MMDDDDYDLQQLLLAAEAEELSPTETPPPPPVAGDVVVATASSASATIDKPADSNSNLIATTSAGTLDSSDDDDDEDAAAFLQRKYNEYGCGIKSQLKKQHAERVDTRVSRDVDASIRSTTSTRRGPGIQPTPHEFPVYKPPVASSTSSFAAKPPASSSTTAPVPFARAADVGVYTDPIFGMRIVHPLVSSTTLQERMQNRRAVHLPQLAAHAAHGDKSVDWAIAGCIVSKSAMQTSKKGAQYCIWKLSDLRPDMRQISVFLFKSACKDLWKTAAGMVVAILNPGVLDNDKQTGEATLSLDTAQRCMVLGQSKDMGTCKARKKNGDPCTALVNRNACEFCVFHVKQEYGKMSTRVELQSATSGRGLEALRNKVLGKSEVFYGGQSFVATVPAKKSAKLVAKDQQRMLTLSEYYQSPGGASTTTTTTPRRAAPGAQGPTSRVAHGIEANVQQRQKDLERLKQLDEENARLKKAEAEKPAAPSTPTVVAVPERFRTLQFSAQAQPRLQSEGFSLDSCPGGTPNISARQAALNRAKALAVLRKTPIAAANPNMIRHRGTEAGRKRAADQLDARDPAQIKKAKISDEAARFQAERIAAIVGAKSAHADLVEQKKADAQDAYFARAEKKEAMEEKMLGTMSMPCKAVTCLQCKYTAFSASDRCKQERHRLKVVDAEKRFFECAECGSRTATVHRMPQQTCKQCQGSKWKRTAMIRDKRAEVGGEKLSIRGDEETFIGGQVSGGNLNLCVAED